MTEIVDLLAALQKSIDAAKADRATRRETEPETDQPKEGDHA